MLEDPPSENFNRVASVKKSTSTPKVTDQNGGPDAVHVQAYGEWEIAREEINDLGRELMRRKNRTVAAREMVNLAALTCAYVRWLVRNDRELAREISKDFEAWPTLVGPRKELLIDDGKVPYCVREVLALPIGEKLPFKTKDVKQDVLYWILSEVIFLDFETIRASTRVRRGLSREIQRLPDLTKATAAQWAGIVAKRVRKDEKGKPLLRETFFLFDRCIRRARKNLVARQERMMKRALTQRAKSNADPSVADTWLEVKKRRANELRVSEGDMFSALKEVLAWKLRSMVRR
jgi:hypothetical protein